MQIDAKTVGFRGGWFNRFYPRTDPGTGPGWYVFGRNPAYGDSYVMLCGRPPVKARRHPHYNCQVRRGWKTRREAQLAADIMNQRDMDCQAFMPNDPLHGTKFKES